MWKLCWSNSSAGKKVDASFTHLITAFSCYQRPANTGAYGAWCISYCSYIHTCKPINSVFVGEMWHVHEWQLKNKTNRTNFILKNMSSV